MSDVVKLSAKLAGDDDLNGLDSLADSLIDDPKTARIAVVWFDCSKIVDDTDTETRVPYARIRRFEPLGNAETMPDVLRQIVEDAAEQRTGKMALPFDRIEGFDE